MAKILIIEDEVELRNSIAEYLLFKGYELVEANDGLEGLEKTHKEQPDIILCDVMMPRLDGYGFLQHHKLSNYAHIPVLLMTARKELNNDLFDLSLSIKGYISKPFNLNQLNQMIIANLVSNK
ncbi:response regulator [uncultured Flavobacterium sp.]|uniref:response regulator transcription factor n=1 Tax=uncultured Flavobacterium sp. TaxID=165435 RepID=UPI0030EB5F09